MKEHMMEVAFPVKARQKLTLWLPNFMSAEAGLSCGWK